MLTIFDPQHSQSSSANINGGSPVEDDREVLVSRANLTSWQMTNGSVSQKDQQRLGFQNENMNNDEMNHNSSMSQATNASAASENRRRARRERKMAAGQG